MYSFVPVDKQNYQVIQGLFAKTDDWVEAPNEAWLHYILSAPSASAELIEYDGDPIGFIQSEKNQEDSCSVALYIAMKFRGQGHGPRSLEAYMKNHTECKDFTALIEQDHLLSLTAFEKAGFRLRGQSKQSGILEYRYSSPS